MYGFSNYGRIVSPESTPSSPASGGAATGGVSGAVTDASTPSAHSIAMDGIEPQSTPAQSTPLLQPDHMQDHSGPGTPMMMSSAGAPSTSGPSGFADVLNPVTNQQQTSHSQQQSQPQNLQQQSPPQAHAHSLTQTGQSAQPGQQSQQGPLAQQMQQSQSLQKQQQPAHQPTPSLYPQVTSTFAPPPPPHMNGMYFSGNVWGSTLDPALEFSRAQQQQQHTQHLQHPQGQADPLLMYPPMYNHARRRDGRIVDGLSLGQNHFVHTQSERKYDHSGPSASSSSRAGPSGGQYRENGEVYEYQPPSGSSYEYYGTGPQEYRYTAGPPTIDGYVPPRLRPAPGGPSGSRPRLWDDQYTNGFHEFRPQQGHGHGPSQLADGVNSLGLGLIHTQPGQPGPSGQPVPSGSMMPPMANHSVANHTRNGPPMAGPGPGSAENKSPSRRLGGAPTVVSTESFAPLRARRGGKFAVRF